MDSETKTLLPSDAIFEILTRSSLETLGRCRTISKEWNRVTYQSTFDHLLRERSNIVSGFFIQSLANSVISSKFVSSDTDSTTSALSLDFLQPRFYPPVEIEASNQGILVCVTYRKRYIVCKPTTKQWVKIPNPKTKYSTASVGLMVLKSKPLSYKIVRLSEAKVLVKRGSFSWRHVRCEVFDSTTWEWNRLNDVVLNDKNFFPDKAKTVVAASGRLHWLLSDCQVLAFDAKEENWEKFSLPTSAIEKSRGDSKLLLAENQGRLAVILKGEESMTMWVLENYGRKLWSAAQTWDFEKHVSPLALFNGDTAVMEADYCRFLFYNFQEGKYCQMNLRHPVRSIFKLQADTEKVNLEGPDRLLKKPSTHTSSMTRDIKLLEST